MKEMTDFYDYLINNSIGFCRTFLGSFWYSAKKLVGAAGKPLDENAEAHKNGFAKLVREVKNAFRHDNYLLSLTVNPNTNSSRKLLLILWHFFFFFYYYIF